MGAALDFGPWGVGSSSDRGHCVYSCGSSLYVFHPRVYQWVKANLIPGVTLQRTRISRYSQWLLILSTLPFHRSWLRYFLRSSPCKNVEGNIKYPNICRVTHLKYTPTNCAKASRRLERDSALLFYFSSALLPSQKLQFNLYLETVLEISVLYCSHICVFHNSRRCYIARRLLIAKRLFAVAADL